MKHISKILFLMLFNFLTIETTLNEEITLNEKTILNEEITLNEKNKKLLIYSIILLSIGLIILFWNEDTIYYNINELYKIAVEISANSTVKGWSIIHEVLKDMDPTSSKNEDIHLILKTVNSNLIDKEKLIETLENLIKLDLEYPNIYSLNSNYFRKSIIKFINFLKNL
jgi:hypothetical protein